MPVQHALSPEPGSGPGLKRLPLLRVIDSCSALSVLRRGIKNRTSPRR